MEQSNIFSDHDIVKSISFNQDEIIGNIIKMYIPGGIECDPTYSKGNFYKVLPKPQHKFDLNIQADGVIQCDCRSLPLPDSSVGSVMFDPPFIVGNNSGAKKARMIDRFGAYKNIKDLWDMYRDSLKEFYRILSPGGVLVFKCQDLSKYGRQYFSEFMVMKMAIACGYYPKDKFILLAKTRMVPPGLRESQVHARKHHSYFLVFIKQRSLVDYR